MLILMKLAIILLAALNLTLLAVWSGVLGALIGDAREPDRMARQVRPEQLRVVRVGAAAPGGPPASMPAASPGAAAASSPAEPPAGATAPATPPASAE